MLYIVRWWRTFDLNIRKYRLLRRLTQKQLARKSGVSQQYISELEKGIIRGKSPTLKILRDLAKALDVCVFALFDPDDCCRNYGNCKKEFRIHMHDDLSSFMEEVDRISKESNVSMQELFSFALEAIKKKYC